MNPSGETRGRLPKAATQLGASESTKATGRPSKTAVGSPVRGETSENRVQGCTMKPAKQSEGQGPLERSWQSERVKTGERISVIFFASQLWLAPIKGESSRKEGW